MLHSDGLLGNCRASFVQPLLDDVWLERWDHRRAGEVGRSWRGRLWSLRPANGRKTGLIKTSQWLFVQCYWFREEKLCQNDHVINSEHRHRLTASLLLLLHLWHHSHPTHLSFMSANCSVTSFLSTTRPIVCRILVFFILVHAKFRVASMFLPRSPKKRGFSHN